MDFIRLAWELRGVATCFDIRTYEQMFSQNYYKYSSTVGPVKINCKNKSKFKVARLVREHCIAATILP